MRHFGESRNQGWIPLALRLAGMTWFMNHTVTNQRESMQSLRWLAEVGAKLWRDRTADERVADLPMCCRRWVSEEAHLPGLANGDRNTVRIENAIGGNPQHSTTGSDNSDQVEWVRRAYRD